MLLSIIASYARPNLGDGPVLAPDYYQATRTSTLDSALSSVALLRNGGVLMG